MLKPLSTSADSRQLAPSNTPAIRWWFLVAGLLFPAISSCEHAVSVPEAPDRSTVSVSVPDSVGTEPSAAGVPGSAGKPTNHADGRDDTQTQSDKIVVAKASESDQYPLQTNPLAGCSICHVDVEDEFVPSRHFKEGVGCQTCHGPSKAHLADENNEVKPDHVFGRKDVDGLCRKCHDCTRPNADDSKGQAHLSATTPGTEHASTRRKTGQTRPRERLQPSLVCIDCHGHHTLARKEPDQPPQN